MGTKPQTFSDEAMVIQLIKTRQLGLDKNQSTQTTSRATGLWGARTSVGLARSTEPSTFSFCRLCLNTCGDRSSPAGPGEEEVLSHRSPCPPLLLGTRLGFCWAYPVETQGHPAPGLYHHTHQTNNSHLTSKKPHGAMSNSASFRLDVFSPNHQTFP